MRLLRTLVLPLLGLVSPAWADMTLTGGITLVKEGGTGHPTASNLAIGKTAFAQDEIGVAPHAISKVNDGISGNSNSWIAGTQNSFVGINLGAVALPVRSVAFARDNTGNFSDRTLGLYEVEYTTVTNPDHNTTSWTSLGTMNYQSAGGLNFTNPSLRHVFNLPGTVMATGIRLKVNATTAFDLTCIDELELYNQAFFEGVALVSQSGSFTAGNLAVTGTAFVKDEYGGTHTAAKLNDGTYGNANSWIGATMDSFAGISLGSTPATLTSVAFGRDNTTGGFTDRWPAVYTLQVTTVPNPTASTPDASWTTVGILDYSNLEQTGNFTLPARRHVWSLPSVQATGFRIKTLATSVEACIDEIELYGTPGISADASLSALTASTGALSPAFASGTTSYTLPAVLYATSSLTITPTATEMAATIQVNGNSVTSGSASGSIPLSLGSNAITVLVTAPDGMTTRNYTINVTRQSAAYSDASLSALGVVAHSLSTAFESNTTNYSVTALPYDTSSLRFTATATETGAVVRLNGDILSPGNPSEPVTLAPGDNTVTIQVTAEDGVTTRAYTIQAFRPGNPRLSGLASSAGTLTTPLNPDITDYNLTLVPYSTSSVMVTVTAAQADATLTLNSFQTITSGVPFNVPLIAGTPTPVSIRVEVPQFPGIRTYTFSFLRASESQSDASLSGLTASTGALSPAFASAQLSYSLPDVADTIPVTLLTATAVQAAASVSISINGSPDIYRSGDSLPLSNGLNIMTVLVTAGDGLTTRAYQIHLTRYPFAETIPALSALTTNAGPVTPRIDSATTSYNLRLPAYINYLTITPTANRPDVSVEISAPGNPTSSVVSGAASQPLLLTSDSNVIIITAFSPVIGGSAPRSYTLTVTRYSVARISIEDGGTALPGMSNTLLAFGSNTDGQCNVPGGTEGIRSISAGAAQSIAVMHDGSTRIFGVTSGYSSLLNIHDVVQAAHGGSLSAPTDRHTLLLLRNGSVLGAGGNGDGQTGIPALPFVRSIAAGEGRSGAVLENGQTAFWGGYTGPFFARSSAGADLISTPPIVSDVAKVVVQNGINLALFNSGGVYAWGENGDTVNLNPVGITDAIDIAASAGNAAYVLRANGDVVGWGAGASVPPVLSGVKAIAGANGRLVAIRNDGTVHEQGYGVDVSSVKDARAIAAGDGHFLVLTQASNMLNLVGGSRTLTLRSVGPDPLVLGTPTITGTGAAAFTVSTLPSTTVLSPGSTPLTIGLASGYAGRARATLHIPSNDITTGGSVDIQLANYDTVAPSIAHYSDVSAHLFFLDDTATVTYEPAIVTDNLDPAPTVTYSHPSGSVFPVGSTTVTITATDADGNSATSTFRVHVIQMPLTHGGSFLADNLATGKTAFAKDEIGIPPYAISNVNNGSYGDASSWIAGSTDSFIGINLGAIPVSISRVAFGRDNTGTLGDRHLGTYELQFTNVPNPSASTPDASWTSIATVVGSARRRLFVFRPREATGFRLRVISPAGDINAIDELEIYGPTPWEAWRTEYFGTASTKTGYDEDFDDDGTANLLEYIFGTSPTYPTPAESVIQAGFASNSSDYFYLYTIRSNGSKDFVTLSIKYTSDFISGAVVDVPAASGTVDGIDFNIESYFGIDFIIARIPVGTSTRLFFSLTARPFKY